MNLFRRNDKPVNRRLRQVKDELRQLESEIHRLENQPEPTATEITNQHPESQAANFKATIPLGIRPTSLSTRELDFFASQQKEFIHLNDQLSPTPQSTPPNPNSHIPSTPSPALSPSPSSLPSFSPRLASYLSAGTVKSLRPLRKDRRIARNRAIVWSIIAIILVILIINFLIKLL